VNVIYFSHHKRKYPLKNISLLVLFFAVVTSCSTLKPTANTAPAQNSNAAPSSPQFIESITVNGGINNTNYTNQQPVAKIAKQSDTRLIQAAAYTENSEPVNITYKQKTITAREEPVKTKKIKNKKRKPAVDGEEVALVEKLSSLQFKYAVKLDMVVEDLWNTKLLAFIDDWYGTRYRYGGSTKAGTDCSGFTGNLMLAVFGITMPRIAKDQYAACKKIKKKNMQQGDLVFFNTRGGVSHVGVYMGNNKFIHASTSRGVMISDLDDDYYHKTFIGAGRPKPEEENYTGKN
jgi:cell wall-associated NlpC family hydrolase